MYIYFSLVFFVCFIFIRISLIVVFFCTDIKVQRETYKPIETVISTDTRTETHRSIDRQTYRYADKHEEPIRRRNKNRQSVKQTDRHKKITNNFFCKQTNNDKRIYP